MIQSGKSIIISFGASVGLKPKLLHNRCFTRLSFWRFSIIWYNFDIDYWMADKLKADVEELKEYFYGE